MNNVDEAYAHCESVARRHYENFPVASVLVPLRMRKHLFAIYAFSRLADDIADEPGPISKEDRVQRLEDLRSSLEAPAHQLLDLVMVALTNTINEMRLPHAPFHRLLNAFVSDVSFTAPRTWDDVLAYCSNSANPIGELLLLLDAKGTLLTAEAIEASNAVCTALQITNFLQDIGTDLSRGRKYLPLPDSEVIRLTRALFEVGSGVVRYPLSVRVRLELRLIIAGGKTMLDLCERRSNRMARPVLTLLALPRLFFHLLFQ